jgi:trigger factor
MSLQIVEKSNEGLSRVYEVTVPVGDLTAKLDAKIKEVGPQLRLKGFRPGKVPAAHVRKMFGRDLMGEIVNEAISESSQKALDDNNVRPASQPELKPTADLDKVVAGEADLSYELAVEIMPEFEPVDISTLELKRPTYAAADADIDEALTQLVSQSKSYEAKGGKAPKAADGDMVVCDFVGRIDGEAFEGGSATDAQIVLGSGQFIPGFEEQLKGVKNGETKTITVTFPDDYGVEKLAGKPAEFEITVKEIRAPKEGVADEDFAKRMGFDSLEALKDALKGQLEAQYGQASRFKLKRALLDALDEKHAFPLPERMVEAEFSGIWRQVEADKAQGNLPPEDAEKSDDDLNAEYRKIAERRVRLGLVLAEIGRKLNVSVSEQEVNAAIMNEARRYPGQERAVFDFYRQNPNAIASVRAPLYEEKVCDAIFEKAKVEDFGVSKEELFADADEE